MISVSRSRRARSFFESELYRYNKSDSYRRVSSLFLQGGLPAGEGRGERSILLKFARSESYGRSLDRGVVTQTRYDQFGGAEEYSFDDEYYRDERAGVLWTYDIKGRFSLPDGTRIFAGGGFERMRYDTNWLDGYMALEWRDTWQQVDTDEGVSIAFDDEGEYDGIHLFLKAGRTTELRSDLRLTAGVHGFVHWTRSRERPIAATEFHSRVDSSLITFSIERPIDISIETTEAGLNLPLAVEYEPEPWISIWSGFRIYATYDKEKDNLPITSAIDLINFLDPSMVASYISRESPRSLENVAVGSTASFGLSLHYRDRFFVDLHTGSDVKPDHLTNYILDVHCAF